jgi:hypothetical protein
VLLAQRFKIFSALETLRNGLMSIMIITRQQFQIEFRGQRIGLISSSAGD